MACNAEHCTYLDGKCDESCPAYYKSKDETKVEMCDEAIDQYAHLVQMFYDGAWRFNHSEPKFQELMDDAVHFLEIECGIKVNKKEIA